MTLEQITTARKNLKSLAKDRTWTDPVTGEDKKALLPLRVMCGDGNMWYDEAYSCFLWDDSNLLLYIVMPNTKETSTLDSRVFPEEIYAIDYDDITKITARVDRYCLDNFLKNSITAGLTNEVTRKRYFDQMTSIYDPKSYLMGMPSTTTEKGGMKPGDDNIISRESVNTL